MTEDEVLELIEAQLVDRIVHYSLADPEDVVVYFETFDDDFHLVFDIGDQTTETSDDDDDEGGGPAPNLTIVQASAGAKALDETGGGWSRDQTV